MGYLLTVSKTYIFLRIFNKKYDSPFQKSDLDIIKKRKIINIFRKRRKKHSFYIAFVSKMKS